MSETMAQYQKCLVRGLKLLLITTFKEKSGRAAPLFTARRVTGRGEASLPLSERTTLADGLKWPTGRSTRFIATKLGLFHAIRQTRGHSVHGVVERNVGCRLCSPSTPLGGLAAY